VVEAISRNRELVGVGPEVLKVVRDPFALSEFVPMPAMRWEGETLDAERRWLQKPLRSSGGFGIAELPLSASERGPGSTVYAQERVDGSPCSALFLFVPAPILLGTCVQLIGEAWLNAPPFRYCGNIGPLPADNAMTAELGRIGSALQSFGLRGLIGIDFIRTNDGIRVLEVNPRYTASVELYERANGQSLMAEHCIAFSPKGWQYSVRGNAPGSQQIHGKAILYAERTFAVPADHPWRGPDFADIPTVGSVIPAGQPVVTLFASADTEPECRERLMELARASAPR